MVAHAVGRAGGPFCAEEVAVSARAGAAEPVRQQREHKPAVPVRAAPRHRHGRAVSSPGWGGTGKGEATWGSGVLEVNGRAGGKRLNARVLGNEALNMAS